MGGALGKAEARADANVHTGAVQVQPGAMQGYAGLQSGAVQGSAAVHSGAIQSVATVEKGAVQVAACVESGAAQGTATVERGAVQGTATVDAIGVERGGVLGIETNGVNMTGIQEGGVRNNAGIAPNAIQINTDQVAMLLMSLGTVAVAITALGGTSAYPWIFLTGMVLAGITHGLMQHRRRAHQVQIQSSRKMTINFIYNQFSNAKTAFQSLTAPHQASEVAEIRQILTELKNEEEAILRVYQETVHVVQVNEDMAAFESFKNQFSIQVVNVQQVLASLGEKIKAAVKEEEHRQQKIKVMSNQNRKHQELDIRMKAIAQAVPTSPEDVIDHEKMRREICQIELERKWTDFNDAFEQARDSFHLATESSEEHQHIADIATLSSEFSKTIEEVRARVDETVKRYAITDQGRLARDIREISNPVASDQFENLNVYSLPKTLVYQNNPELFRQYDVGFASPEDFTVPTKIIMMAGMTGAGKSLMINNIVNYVFGVNCEDDFRLKLILETDEIADRKDGTTDVADSMTRFVTSYRLAYQKGFRVKYSLILIDTPGFGDSRGLEFDQQTVKSLQAFFNNKEGYAVEELSSLGLVIQASQSRLTAEQMYVFNSVLDIFGNDVAKNICLLFTFADAQLPPALATVKKEGIPFSKDGVFKFNNSAVFADNIDDEATRYYWKFGFKSLENFFLHIGGVQPASLTLTKKVLDERATLHVLLDILRRQIDEGFDRLQCIESMTTDIMKLKGNIKANRRHKVKKTVHPQETKVVNHHITNCKPCMFTCHDPCYIAGDQKQGCASMSDGRCVACPGKCPWDSHSNGDRIYIYGKVEVEETIEDMMKNYNIAVNDRNGKLKLLRELQKEYYLEKDNLFVNIKTACDVAKRLEEISLGKSVLTSVDYIARLIRSEENSNRPNKAARIKQLTEFKKKAQLLADARSNKLEKLTTLTSYEKTVREAVEKAEMEDEEDQEMEDSNNNAGDKEGKGFMASVGDGLVKMGKKMGGGGD